jgi:Macrocin-O-methyltransferase (TylF)
VFLKGCFSETLPHAHILRVAVLRLDGDMYESTTDGLTNLYDKVSGGGFVIVDDFGAVEGCKRVVVDFRKERGIKERGIEDRIQDIDGIGAFWRKSAAAVTSSVGSALEAAASAGQ